MRAKTDWVIDWNDDTYGDTIKEKIETLYRAICQITKTWNVDWIVGGTVITLFDVSSISWNKPSPRETFTPVLSARFGRNYDIPVYMDPLMPDHVIACYHEDGVSSLVVSNFQI